MSFFGPATVKESDKLRDYELKSIKDHGELKELIPEELYMLSKIEVIGDGETEGWIKFAFFSVLSVSGNDPDDIKLELIMHGEGFGGALRECRHTYWGEEGYIFYPNASHFKAIFKELSVYFDDMDF